MRFSLFGKATQEAALPDSVRRAIDHQSRQSEILVSVIQLLVVATFAVLYGLAPQPYVEAAQFKPIPYVLTAYFAFTVIRLALSLKGKLPNGLVYLSVVVDMALLMATIWSFHIQYMQPPSFYLKAPTILYVFIFIALRALRFDIRYLLVAGAVAALGWSILVFYVIYSDPTNPMITRNYVEYMTSNAILIGAEMDKIISILLVTAILALAVWRARTTLVRAVAEEQTTRSLSKFFPEAVAKRIADDGDALAPGRGVTCEAAILFMDIRGFTPAAERLSPDSLITLLTEYQACTVPVIQAAGGSVDKFLGDGILATFGAVTPSKTPARDALVAVDGLIDAVAAWNGDREARGLDEIRIGIGVSVGTVTFGIIGDTDRLEYTVIGNPVNLAAKLEAHTKAAQVQAITDAQTHAAALAQGYASDRPLVCHAAQSVHGVSEPLDLIVLAERDLLNHRGAGAA